MEIWAKLNQMLQIKTKGLDEFRAGLPDGIFSKQKSQFG
jgi:hypothetical protein